MSVFSRNSLVALFLTLFAAAAAGQQVATPTFSPNGGWFLTEKAVTVTTTTSGATINYTTDGATPTSTDRTVVSGGTVLIDRPLTLKANATKTGMTPSSTAAAAFTISGKLAGGQSHSVVLRSDGTIWSWGSNSVGQLSIGTTDSATHTAPVQAKLNSTTLLSGISGVAAGASHSLAIKAADGSVYGWGSDSAGQLGDNSAATQQLYPVQAKTTANGNPLIVGITDAAGGAAHSIALKSDGTVWAWGSNTSGQLGDGSTTSRKLAAQVKTSNHAFLTSVNAIAAGDNFSIALKSDGTVWAWGINSAGQLGIGSTTSQSYAVQVKLSSGTALSGVSDIVCGSAFAAALKSDGTIWTWGSNTNGQLGNGTTTQANNPVQAKINSTTFIGGSYALAAGATHTLVLKTDGSVWSCGLNSSGQLSINSTTQQLYFVQGSASSGVFLSGIVDIGAGGSHSLVTQSDGTVLGCGLNASGQAGYPTTTVNPTRATAIANFLIISAFADPDNDGIPTWRERELGTNPTISDTDGDGIPDGWEVNHNLNPLVNDASADPDGDGFSNLQEYQNNTDPYDYYNSAPFTLNIVSGNNQASPTGFWVGQPLVVRTANGSGGSLTNAPVTFTLAQAGGGLSLTDHGTTASSLSLRTDTSGQATVYYLQPSSGTSGVNVQAGTGSVQQVSFTASFLNIPITGMKLWLRSDAGVTKDANNLVSLWRDQSPAGNNAAQGVIGNSPLFVANGWSGKPVIRFNGSTSSMNGAMSLSSQMSVFAVAAEGSGVGFKRLINNEGHFYLGTTPDGNFASFYGSGTWGTTQSHPFALTANQVTMLESINNGSDSAYVNGQLVETRANSMTAFTNGFELGRHPAGIQYWDGDILEVLVYDGVLSTADRQAVEIYLNQKYNVVVPPAGPSGITATPMSYGRIDVAWTAPAGASSYSVERKTGVGGAYATIGTTSSVSFADVTVVAGSQYYYRVFASNIAGQSAYSGEATASVESLPAIPTSGIAFWLRAERGVTMDQTNHVSSWLDQSGQNVAGTQSTAAVQPLFVDNSMNGKPVVRFDGLDDVLLLPNFASALTGGEVFIVAKASATQVDVSTLWMMGDDSIWNPNTYPGGDGTVCETFGTRNQKCTGVPSQPLNQVHVYNVSSKTGEFVSRFNGIEHYRTTSNTVFFPSAPQLGGGVYYRHRFGGDIAEMLVYDHVLTQAERDAVTAYYQAKYGMLDSDGDGLVDWKEIEIGTDPHNADTDRDGIPDAWEFNQGTNPLANDAAADPDGDGFTNLQEYQNNTNPFDYFNGASFSLNVSSGQGQSASPGVWLSQPLVVLVTNGSGVPLANAPVTFSVTSSGGTLSASNGGTETSTLSCRTDAAGHAVASFTTPGTARLAVVNAQTGITGSVKQVSFTASTTDATFPFIGLKLCLRGDAGVVKDGGNAISSWIDGTGSGNDAVQNSGPDRPLFVDNNLNGKPVVRFDGVSDSLNLPNFASTFTEGEVFVVLKSTKTQPGANTLWMAGDDYVWGPEMYPSGDGTILENFGTRNQKQTGRPSQALNQFHLYNVSSKAGEFASRINGRQHFKTTSNTVFFPNGPVLGGGVYYDHRFGGDIAEILIFNRVLSQQERDEVGVYLNDKYRFVADPPRVPTNVRAQVLSSGQVALSWLNPLSNAVTYYDVQRRTGMDAFETIATVTNGLSYIDSTAAASSQYTYRIVARNDAGSSLPSAEVTAATSAGGAPVPLADIRLWLKADEGVSTDHANVWTDSSGNSNNAIQVSVSSQPQVIESAINGRPVVHFDGTDDFMSLPSFANGFTQGEVFVVLKSPGPTQGTDVLWMMGDDYVWGPSMYPAGDGTINETFGTRNRKTTGKPSQALDQFHLYNVSSKSNEFVTRINGREHFRTSDNTVFFPANPLLGAGLYGDHRFRGDIAEIVVFDRVLTQPERNAVDLYLNGKYLFVAAAPPVPEQLRAWPLNSTQVSLSWSSPISNAMPSYDVQRRTATDDFETIATVTNGLNYLDNTTEPSTQYFYRVVARNDADSAAPSTEMSITTPVGGVPIPIADIKLWLKGDEGVSKDRASVWTDSSGNSNNAFQITPSSQPQVVENAINGRPVVRFDGADDSLNLSSFANGFTQGEVFIVAKASATQADVSTLWTMGDDYVWTPNTYPGGDGTVCETFGTRNQKNTGVPSQSLNQPHLYNVSSKAGEFVTRFNGSEHYRTANNTVFFPSNAIVGGGVYERHRFGGDIAELIVFNRVLTQSERDQVQSYLAEKYSLTSFDLDGDGLTTAQELALGTDPRNADTNGDGISDGASVRLGINPLGPGYVWPPSPQPPSNTPLNFTLSDPPGAILLP